MSIISSIDIEVNAPVFNLFFLNEILSIEKHKQKTSQITVIKTINLNDINKSISSNFHPYNIHKQKRSQVNFIKTKSLKT